MPSEVTELIKKIETLEEENNALRKHIDHIESRVALWQKEHKEAVQLELRDLKETIVHSIMEDVEGRIADATKKEVGPLERIRLYFVNKKMRSEVMKQLL